MKEISCYDIDRNVFDLFLKEYSLLAAGDESGYNMMTISWGAFGALWNKEIVTVFVRPTRHTYGHMEDSDYFTVSWFGAGGRNETIHKVCGSKSGRDTDKASLAGLKPVFSDNTVYFDDADMVIICKKIYFDDLKPENFLSDSERWYNNDYHRIYVGQIEKIYVRD